MELNSFEWAAQTTLPFGKFKGETLEEIAGSDEGLRYIDWLAGTDLYGDVKEAVSIFTKDPSIAKEIASVIG